MDGSKSLERFGPGRMFLSWWYLPRLEDADKVAALDAGADDYIVKPFSVDELLARIRVALRRVERTGYSASEESCVYDNGGLHIDFAAACVTLDGEEVHLTPMEYKLLCVLARNTGKVLTHNYILKRSLGLGPLRPDMASLRVFMATLRKKIEFDPSHPRYVQTHVGIGYRMMKVDADEGFEDCVSIPASDVEASELP